MSKRHPFIMVMQAAENSFCRNSDKVVSLLPCAQAYFMDHGMPADHFYHVPNGIVEAEWQNPEPLSSDTKESIEKLRDRFGFVVCFFGSHTKSYAIDYLIGAAQELSDENVGFLLVGDGVYKKELERLAEGCENVVFHPPIPKASIPSLLQEVDGIYVGMVNSELAQFGICMNKLFDAMMSGRPIVYASNAPNNYVEEYCCGISCAPEDSAALADSVRRLIAIDETEREAMGRNGRCAVKEHFVHEQLATMFLEIMAA